MINIDQLSTGPKNGSTTTGEKLNSFVPEPLLWVWHTDRQDYITYLVGYPYKNVIVTVLSRGPHSTHAASVPVPWTIYSNKNRLRSLPKLSAKWTADLPFVFSCLKTIL